MYLHVCKQFFSHFIQIETQFIHFASVCISEKGEGGERDLVEWRARSGRGERGEQKYMYLYNFLLLYTNRNRSYTIVVSRKKILKVINLAVT